MGRTSSLLLGGLIGAGLAMVLAPGTKARIRATELINTGRDALDEKLAIGQDLVNTAVEKARAGLERLESEADRLEASQPKEREANHQQF